MLFHGAARTVGGHAGIGAGIRRLERHLFETFSVAMTLLIMAAEAASPMAVAPRKIVTGLVSTAMMVTESPFSLRDGSAIVTSASTRAALVPSTVIDDVF